MKRILFILTAIGLLASLVLLAGCTSPAAKAQKLYNEGRYEEVITQYGSDPNMSAIVAQSKEKLAEQMVAEGRYDEVIATYPQTVAAKEARNKKAEQLFMAGSYQDVVTNYMDTPWGPQAKLKLDSIATAGQAPGTRPGSTTRPTPTQPSGPSAATEAAAQAELDRIMAIRVPDLRTKALREFVTKAEYAGTRAMAKAQQELSK